MPFVRLYGDIHSSEESAKTIHKRAKKQNPDVIFYESDLQGPEFEYFKKSLSKYYSFMQIISAFNMNPDEFQEYKGSLDTPLFELDSEVLENFFKGFFNTDSGLKSEVINKIKSPEEHHLGQNKDMASYALFQNYTVRKSEDRNTLILRLFYENANNPLNFEKIDINRDEMFVHGAKDIDKLPNDPKKVKRIFSLVRNEKLNQVSTLDRVEKNRVVEGVSELLSEFKDKRENTMAAQIEDEIDSHHYQNAAVIVGRRHVGPMAEFLSDIDGYKIETYDAKKSDGVLKSVKDKFF